MLVGAGARKGSTSVGACEVRCWRWLFGNKIPVSLQVRDEYRMDFDLGRGGFGRKFTIAGVADIGASI